MGNVRLLGLLATAVAVTGCSKFQNFDFYQLPLTDGELRYVPYCSQAGSETLNLPLVASSSGARSANVVFVIDTSGSMANETDEVRANTAEFVDGVKKDLPAATTKFAVIGTRQSRDKEVLPATYVKNAITNDVYWHYQGIGSTDKFQKIMRSYGMTTFTSAGSTYNVGSTVPAIPNANFEGSCSTTGPLFNCSALNHIVIVTDDIEDLPNVANNDKTVKDAFLGSFGAHLAKNKNGFRIHAIHAKAASTCDIAEVGTIYELIAAAMGSLSLDVCTTDWSPLFRALKDNIVASSRAVGFGSCASATRSIVSVHVKWSGGDVTLAPADYVYTNASGQTDSSGQGLQASIYVSPQKLEAKGIPIDGTPLTLVIESTW